MEFVVKTNHLQPVRCTFTKTIQLYETMVVRHGVMTVGTTGGGKTTVLNVNTYFSIISCNIQLHISNNLLWEGGGCKEATV